MCSDTPWSRSGVGGKAPQTFGGFRLDKAACSSVALRSSRYKAGSRFDGRAMDQDRAAPRAHAHRRWRAAPAVIGRSPRLHPRDAALSRLRDLWARWTAPAGRCSAPPVTSSPRARRPSTSKKGWVRVAMRGGRAARETFAHGFEHWGSGLEGRTQGAARVDGPVSLPTWPQEHEEGVAPRRTSWSVWATIGQRSLTARRRRYGKALLQQGFSMIGAPRFELGTSCPPDKRANQAAPRPVGVSSRGHQQLCQVCWRATVSRGVCRGGRSAPASPPVSA